MTGRPPETPAARVFRNWTNPSNAKHYRIVMEEPARHRIRMGDTRWTLTFVDMDATQHRQVTTMVPDGFDLASATQKALLKLLMDAR